MGYSTVVETGWGFVVTDEIWKEIRLRVAEGLSPEDDIDNWGDEEVLEDFLGWYKGLTYLHGGDLTTERGTFAVVTRASEDTLLDSWSRANDFGVQAIRSVEVPTDEIMAQDRECERLANTLGAEKPRILVSSRYS